LEKLLLCLGVCLIIEVLGEERNKDCIVFLDAFHLFEELHEFRLQFCMLALQCFILFESLPQQSL
jgi:hypothetical protein